MKVRITGDGDVVIEGDELSDEQKAVFARELKAELPAIEQRVLEKMEQIFIGSGK